MKEMKDTEKSPVDCCPGDTGASCGCGAAPPRRPWVKTVIAVVILLAAGGVGAYSLLASPAPGEGIAPAGVESSQRPNSPNTAAQSPPSAEQPACCGGAAQPVSTPQPSCCGGETSMDPEALPDEPRCGAKPKGCCGQ